MLSKNHYYFILAPNFWPFSASFCSFNLLFSLLIFFKTNSTLPFFVSLMSMTMISFSWWLNYSKEFSVEGKESFSLEEGLKLSMILFISSEVLFFFSFFWSYFHFFLSPLIEVGLSWPPALIGMFDFSEVPMINTLILVTSGVTVTLSHDFLTKGKMNYSLVFLFLTVILGLMFSYLQWMEYCSSFFSISDSTFGATFFVLTGFHGVHVLIGTIFLLAVLIKAISGSPSSNDSTSFELASWYWHFVDVVWLFLFFCLYYMNN